MSKLALSLATAGAIAVGPVAAASAAPSTPAPSTPSPSTQTVVKHESDKSGLWGLLGLAGLAGLIPRKKQVNVQPRRVEDTHVQRATGEDRVGNTVDQGRDRLSNGRDDLRR